MSTRPLSIPPTIFVGGLNALKNARHRCRGTISWGWIIRMRIIFKRLLDFLLEIELDLAEFTILTPFAHTPDPRADGTRRAHPGIMTGYVYRRGSGLQARKMSVDSLQEMYEYAWKTFYGDFSKK